MSRDLVDHRIVRVEFQVIAGALPGVHVRIKVHIVHIPSPIFFR
jgi:hypothetical protein